MPTRLLPSGALLLILLTGATLAEQSPTTPERDDRALAALQKMGAALQALTSFEIEADSSTDQVLGSGQTVQLDHHTRLLARRPDRLRVSVDDGEWQRSLYYDGKEFVLYANQHNYYARLQAPKTIDALIDLLETDYGIQMPLADLFRWSADPTFAERQQDALYIGTEYLQGRTCEHYAYRQPEMDWQLWLEAGERALPCQLQIVDRSDPALPRHTINLRWNLAPTVAVDAFAFKAPADARPISLRELDRQAPTEQQ